MDNELFHRWDVDGNKRDGVQDEVERCLMKPRMNLYILCMERTLKKKKKIEVTE